MFREGDRKSYQNARLLSDFRGLKIAGTRTRPGQMHPQKTQTEPEAENTVHDAAAVIAREKVSRKTVPDDSRKSRVLVVSSPHGNAGETPDGSAINSLRIEKVFTLYITICSGMRIQNVR